MISEIPEGDETDSPETEHHEQREEPARLPPQIEQSIDRVVEQRARTEQNHTRGRMHRDFNFDLQNFEYLQQATFRELTPEDNSLVGELYTDEEMENDVFEAMFAGDYADADERAEEGGMLKPWMPTQAEAKILRKLCPNYVTPSAEFLSFLNGTHRRPSDFRAWGMFGLEGNLIAVASGFLPPKDEHRLSRHAKYIRNFFRWRRRGKKILHIDGHTALVNIHRHARTTAEFYLIASNRPGAGTLVFNQMLEAIERQYPELTDMYLERFASMKMVYPHPDNRTTHDSPNMKSRKFFRKRGFGDCGHRIDKGERACRQIGPDLVVAVEPKWMIMHGEMPRIKAGSRTEVQHLYARGGKMTED